MTRALIVTQGELAAVLLHSAETITGRAPRVTALGVGWDDGPEVVRSKISSALEALDPGDGLLILTDMVGGTPYNVAQGFRATGRVEVVAGVNLPMVLRLECMEGDDRPVAELAEWIAAKGRRSIGCCGDGAGGRG